MGSWGSSSRAIPARKGQGDRGFGAVLRSDAKRSLVEISTGLGEPMVGINVGSLSQKELMARPAAGNQAISEPWQLLSAKIRVCASDSSANFDTTQYQMLLTWCV